MSLQASIETSRAAPWRIPDDTAALAALAAQCLRLEVETAPKPGLVSHLDSGSHTDMDLQTFHRSTAAIQPFFRELARAGAEGGGMERLRATGLRAEQAMLVATGGVNTHRGAIFGLGLLCAAAGARLAGRAGRSETLGAIVVRRWGREILETACPGRSHGQAVRRRYGVGGASAEAARGFPALYAVGLPALRAGRRLAPDDAQAARVHCCFALIGALVDTNLLHRGGMAGLLFAQHAARGFIAAGGVGGPDWRARAGAVHRAFVARSLSPGGSADLLAMSLFAQAIETKGT